MSLLKLEFNQGYDKADFYARTGMFFAEKKYRREMPYLINSPEKEWCLFYENDQLAGFYGREFKEESVLISGFYVTENFRHTGLADHMLEDITNSYEAVRMVTCSQHLLKKLLTSGFVRISNRGSYQTMEWKRKDNQ